MADVHTKDRRSYNMSRIRSRDTKPEILLRKALWREGFRYSLKAKLPGRPDIVMKKHNLIIFIDGCFWHGCPKHFRMPDNNRSFWKKKIEGNMTRDRRNTKALRKEGWTVLRLWEHDVRKRLPYVLEKIKKAVDNNKG